jgi:hypothetical protein
MIEAAQTVPLARIEINLSEKDIARFWSKVDKNGPTLPHMETPCWVWKAGRHDRGYGHFSVKNKTVRAHRLSWLIEHKFIQRGFFVCHRCDNPSCCRPDHLQLGLQEDNMRDMQIRGRSARGDRHGSSTHPESRPRGSNNVAAKLAELDIIAIREIYTSRSASYQDLARMFHVSKSLIRHIVLRSVWKHLP